MWLYSSIICKDGEEAAGIVDNIMKPSAKPQPRGSASSSASQPRGSASSSAAYGRVRTGSYGQGQVGPYGSLKPRPPMEPPAIELLARAASDDIEKAIEALAEAAAADAPTANAALVADEATEKAIETFAPCMENEALVLAVESPSDDALKQTMAAWSADDTPILSMLDCQVGAVFQPVLGVRVNDEPVFKSNLGYYFWYHADAEKPTENGWYLASQMFKHLSDAAKCVDLLL